ncbi:Uncharacterised protein [Starkeya nomas]|uniref:Mu-like prophage FluMu N-terminal domain-containing protein n=1 Tax=Starkeya nomas TaxID=2666134 RepID=A0A5S9N9X5_9HYPH|nr:hypothetical protein [Starkeya nomas]CAA0086921.1 Uncharacterised protein [Starkeya nomas]
MAKRATPVKAAGKAKPAATNTPPSEKSGPVDETLSSTGRGEALVGETLAPQQAQDAPGQQAQPAPVEGAPASVNPDGSHADGDGPVRDAPEAGQVTEVGSAAAASVTASHPAGALIDEARVARGPTDDAPKIRAPDEPIRLTYPVLSPLRRDGQRYSPDDPDTNTIELTEAEAETLIAIGVLGETIS